MLQSMSTSVPHSMSTHTSVNGYLSQWVPQPMGTSVNEYLSQWLPQSMGTLANEYRCASVNWYLTTSVNGYLSTLVHGYLSTPDNEYLSFLEKYQLQIDKIIYAFVMISSLCSVPGYILFSKRCRYISAGLIRI